MRNLYYMIRWPACAVALAMVFGACAGNGGEEKPSASDAGSPGGTAQPVYAMLATVFNTDDSATSYILMTHTLDLGSVSLRDAREFSGRVEIATTGGYLFVASGEDPR